MSDAVGPLYTAIYDKLQLDSTIRPAAPAAPLLALDPTVPTIYLADGITPALAIFPGQSLDTALPAYPCITYRAPVNTAVKAFEDPLPGLPSAPVDDVRIDFEAWAGPYANDALVRVLLGVIEGAWRNQSFALVGGQLSGGGNANVFRCQKLTDQTSLYDNVIKAHFGVYSLLFRIQR